MIDLNLFSFLTININNNKIYNLLINEDNIVPNNPVATLHNVKVPASDYY